MFADLLASPVLGLVPWGVLAAILVAGLIVLAVTFYLTDDYRAAVVTTKPQAPGLASDRRRLDSVIAISDFRRQRSSSVGSDVPGGGAW